MHKVYQGNVVVVAIIAIVSIVVALIFFNTRLSVYEGQAYRTNVLNIPQSLDTSVSGGSGDCIWGPMDSGCKPDPTKCDCLSKDELGCKKIGPVTMGACYVGEYELYGQKYHTCKCLISGYWNKF